MTSRTCPECGAAMNLHRADAITCSVRCRSRRHRARRHAASSGASPAPPAPSGVPSALLATRRRFVAVTGRTLRDGDLSESLSPGVVT